MLAKHKLRALERIREAHQGLLDPPDIVAEAEDPNHELHDEFQWDNDTAAHEFRLHQARKLIRSVEILRTEETHTISAVYYIHHPSLPAGKSGYIPVTQLAHRKADAVAALEAELSRIEGAIRRGRDIAAFLSLAKDFEALLKEVIQIRRKL